MKIALAQFNPTIGDFEGNAARIVELAREAKAGGAELALFSELCLCGYPPQDLVERPSFVERNLGTRKSCEIDSAGVARRLRRQGPGQHRETGGKLRRAYRGRPHTLRTAKNAAPHL